MALDEEQQRIRGYLQTQAAKLDLPDLIAKVRTDMQQVRSAAEAVSADRFSEKPAPGEWSANEIMAHIVGGAKGNAEAILGAIETGKPPAVGARDQMEATERQHSASEWWEALESARTRLFERASKAKGDEHLDVTWDHPFFGPLNWREWLLFQRIHDLDHARQMQSLTDTKI
ncbi:MAG: DinB family protein [Tepidiformaceae bacterium]